MSEHETYIGKLVSKLSDILSTGQICGFDEWHEKSIQKMFEGVSSEHKKEVFEAFYSDPDDQATIEEIKWMMEECEVKTFTVTLTQ